MPPPGHQATAVVVERGWHTDISLVAEPLDHRFDALRTRFPGARAFVFGFGQRLYLLNRNDTVLDMLRALLPSDGMILVTALNTTPEAAFGPDQAIALAVSPEGFANAADFVRNSIGNDQAGTPEFIRDGPYPGSAFYASTLTYDGLNTCNTWTAEAVRAAGVPVTADAVVFASQVTGQLRWRAQR